MTTPKVRSEVKIEEVDITEELKAVTMTVQDLAYNGFSAKKVREDLSLKLTTSEVVTLTSAYCQIGNNLSRATGKVMKARVDIPVLLKKAGTTLARVGLAYPALVRAIRHQFPLVIGPRISECKTPSDYQDPACAPYHPDGRDFHEKFSALIFNPLLAKKNVDYFAIAVKNRDALSEPLMRFELPEIIKLMKQGKY
jgi:hypothetical protein